MKVDVALAQLNSRDDKAANITEAEARIVEAAEGGARLVVLPELWTYLGPDHANSANAETIPGPLAERLGGLARRYGITLHAGSMLERADENGVERVYNTALVFDASGALVATYRKVHLFDAEPTDQGAPYRESATTAAGDQIVTIACDGLRLGFATCYDLRFPELFRALALSGAEIVALPAAFTLETGRDHWEPLVRARAIENGCYVLAAAQCGPRPPDRRTFGHSMIVDPWGRVLAEGPEDATAIVRAEVDTDSVADVRRRIPSLANRRPDVY